MCDLNAAESGDIIASLNEVTSLSGKVTTYIDDIGKTSYMDHENLAALLADLRDRAEVAREWVAAKPHQHAGH
jgi:hypothetical protein